ncbi:hypothetical protein Tco_1032296 [Tanacetum coccineum]|uniref:Reverse transcriptase domain-containing protein n=1 Tax=Tanacetum coccineum TaxID=301880 RepID=A0ABQ5GBF2_9ASTR
MEESFYHLTVKGNDLKIYVRRFQELATLFPTMVPDSEKMIEVFIRELPRSIEWNVTASNPQTLEEANDIAHRLMDQDLALSSVLLATRWAIRPRTVETKGQPLEVICYQRQLLVMPVEKKGILQISAERPPTRMPREEPTC